MTAARLQESARSASPAKRVSFVRQHSSGLTLSRLRNSYTSSYWPREHYSLTRNTTTNRKCSPSKGTEAKVAVQPGCLVTRPGYLVTPRIQAKSHLVIPLLYHGYAQS